MFSEKFDIEDFALDLSKQAQEIFPPEIPNNVKNFITQVIYEFIKIAYDALGKEERLYDVNESVLICQLVGEWMYHKGIDNYKNEIPQKYWKPILQQVAFAIWETAKEAIQSKNKEQDTIIQEVQEAVYSVYGAMIRQLAGENKLTKSVDEIMAQSSLDDYVEEKYNLKNDLKNVVFFNKFKDKKNKALKVVNKSELKGFPTAEACQETDLKLENITTNEPQREKENIFYKETQTFAVIMTFVIMALAPIIFEFKTIFSGILYFNISVTFLLLLVVSCTFLWVRIRLPYKKQTKEKIIFLYAGIVLIGLTYPFSLFAIFASTLPFLIFGFINKKIKYFSDSVYDILSCLFLLFCVSLFILLLKTNPQNILYLLLAIVVLTPLFNALVHLNLIHNKILAILSYPFVNFKVKQQIKELEQVKNDMRKMVDPQRGYEEIEKNNHILRIELANNLIPLFDPELEGKVLSYIIRLRTKILAKELGYVIPNVMPISSPCFPDNHYEIFVQNKSVFSGIVYPDRVMVLADDWNKLGLPDNIAICITENEKQYWISKTDIPRDKEIKWLEPEMVIVENLRKTAIKYVDYILSVSEVVKYNEIIKKKNKPLLDIVLKNIDIADIRVILVELIKEEYSIKAILLIYEKIAQYSAQTKDPKEIADKIKKDLDELK